MTSGIYEGKESGRRARLPRTKDKMIKIIPYPRKREAKYAADLMLQEGCLVSYRSSLLKKPWPPNFDRIASGRTNLQWPRGHEQPAR